MNNSPLRLLLSGAFAAVLIALTALIASSAVPAVAAAAPGPAWVARHTLFGTTPDGSQSGPSFTGLATENFAYVMASVNSLTNDNTTIAIWDATKTGTPVEVALNLSGTGYSIEKPRPGRFLTDDFVFVVTNTFSGMSTLYRWNSLYGVEWFISRGKLPATDHSYVVDEFNGFIITSLGVIDGLAEEIVALATNPETHGMQLMWVQVISIPDSVAPVPYQTYARDFVYLASLEPTIAFISLGRVYSVDTSQNVIVTKVHQPCGFTSDEFNMKALTLSGLDSLVVYGNVKGAKVHGNGTKTDAFVICVLEMTPALTARWNFTFNYTIDTDANCIAATQTTFRRGAMWFTVQSLFVSGNENIDNWDSAERLWALDLPLGGMVWFKDRLPSERTNMPVFVGDAYGEHVAVTIQGRMQGVDPANGKVQWMCYVGCYNTPAVLRNPTTQALSRAVCAANTYRFDLYALDVGGPQGCVSVWNYTLNTAEADVTVQNTFGVLEYTNIAAGIESFVTVPLDDGQVNTISFRADNEPVPTPPPTAAPAPTLPPDTYPRPYKKVITGPPMGFSDVSIESQTGAQFNANGPLTCVIGEVTMLDATQNPAESSNNNNGVKSAIGSRYLTIFFATVDYSNPMKYGIFFFTRFISGLYNYLLPIVTFYSSPAPGNSIAGGYAAYTSMTTGLFDLVIVSTDSQNAGNNGVMEVHGRFGASQPLAVDVTTPGLLFYTTGYVAGNENLNALYNTGSGSKSTLLFSVTLPQFVGARNYTSYAGNLVSIRSTAHGSLIVFSHLDTLLFYKGPSKQLQFFGNIDSPCGFSSTPSTAHLFAYMTTYNVGKQGDTALVIINTARSEGENTFGLCLVQGNDAVMPNAWSAGLLRDVVMIQTVTSVDGWLAGSDVYMIIEYYDRLYAGAAVAFNQSGAVLWTAPRMDAIGSIIVPVPSTNAFIGNWDSSDKTLPPEFFGMALSYVTIAGSSAPVVTGACPFSCTMAGMIKDSQGRYVVLCPLTSFANIVRAVRFDDGGATCTVVWETDMGAVVVGISNTNEFNGLTIPNVPGSMATIVTLNGYMVGVTADPHTLTTVAPTTEVTTVAPTAAPATVAPTAAPATAAPATAAPATAAPATAAPATAAPATAAPVTAAPVTGTTPPPPLVTPTPTKPQDTTAPTDSPGSNNQGTGGDNDKGGDGMSGGAVAAIIISVLLICGVAAGCGWVIFKKRRRQAMSAGYLGVNAGAEEAGFQAAHESREVRMSYGTELGPSP